MSEQKRMTEDEAIVLVVRGSHPGNCFDSPPLGPRDRDAASRRRVEAFLDAIPKDWHAFRRVTLWWLEENKWTVYPEPPVRRNWHAWKKLGTGFLFVGTFRGECAKKEAREAAGPGGFISPLELSYEEASEVGSPKSFYEFIEEGGLQ